MTLQQDVFNSLIDDINSGESLSNRVDLSQRYSYDYAMFCVIKDDPSVYVLLTNNTDAFTFNKHLGIYMTGDLNVRFDTVGISADDPSELAGPLSILNEWIDIRDLNKVRLSDMPLISDVISMPCIGTSSNETGDIASAISCDICVSANDVYGEMDGLRVDLVIDHTVDDYKYGSKLCVVYWNDTPVFIMCEHGKYRAYSTRYIIEDNITEYRNLTKAIDDKYRDTEFDTTPVGIDSVATFLSSEDILKLTVTNP